MAVMDMVSILIMITPTLPATAPVITEYNIALTDRHLTIAVAFLTSSFLETLFFTFWSAIQHFKQISKKIIFTTSFFF